MERRAVGDTLPKRPASNFNRPGLSRRKGRDAAARAPASSLTRRHDSHLPLAGGEAGLAQDPPPAAK